MSNTDANMIVEGVVCYAPELAFGNDNYSPEFFKRMYAAEEKNFWFRSRNRLIKYIVLKYKKRNQIDFLEIGCGTGFVLSGLSSVPKIHLSGSEIFLEGLKYTKKRLPEIDLFQLDATKIPFTERFDMIGAFDVLEHISDDEKVMSEVLKALKIGGYFIISVPQHRFLWSYLDDMAFHKRRYTRGELREKLQTSGYKVEYITSFVFMLFPIMFVSRYLKKGKKREYTMDDNMAELELSPFLNKILTLFMRFDELLIKAGIRLPFGGSLIAVARKVQ